MPQDKKPGNTQLPPSQKAESALVLLHSHLFRFENMGWSASYEARQLATLHQDNLVPRYIK